MFVNPELTLALRVEVMHDGKVVASGEAYWSDRFPSGLLAGDLSTLFRASVSQANNACVVDVQRDANSESWGGDGWTVFLTGDANVALRDIGCKKYWKGQVEIPLAQALVLGQDK